MQKTVFNFTILVFITLISSCQKEIQIDIPEGEDKIVVEGYIYSNESPFVILTHNNTSQSASMLNIITDALVIVSDGQNSDTLKQAPNGYLAGIYFDLDNNFKGIAGKTYFLRISSGGKTVSAQTTIPQPVPLDSLWYKTENNNSDLGYGWAHFTDPDTTGNFYKLYSKELHHDNDFTSPLGDTFDDKSINGKGFSFFFGHGNNPTNIAEGMFTKGDTIVVKFCSVDKNTYNFWRTFEVQINTNGNPFASPATIETNIKGGLGIWGGYGSWVDTLIAN